MENQDRKYMLEAIKLAEKAYDEYEVPIGAIIIHEDKVIGKGYNQRNGKKNPLYHAEIQAIDEAAKYIGDWRLENCTMYVTLEPCPMCAGAIVQARIDKVFIATMNPKAGCAGSILNILDEPRFNHQVEVVEGLCKEESSQLLKSFFSLLRKK